MKKEAHRSAQFARAIPRPIRRTSGATEVERTPLNVRTSGVDRDPDLIAYARNQLSRKLGKLAPRIERLTVRYEDVNGPRGGVDTVCRIKVVLSGLPSVLFEARATDVRGASDLAFGGVARAVKRVLARALSADQPTRGPRKGTKVASPPERADRTGKRHPQPSPEEGSLIGRRVGRGAANLEKALERPEKRRRDAPVDTAMPGRSATDRRAGGGSTARRNTKRSASGMTSALEDSARDRPSRKSTRKSSNRSKRDSNLQRRRIRATGAPSARASRAKAQASRGR